jgi:hypothetical protein
MLRRSETGDSEIPSSTSRSISGSVIDYCESAMPIANAAET